MKHWSDDTKGGKLARKLTGSRSHHYPYIIHVTESIKEEVLHEPGCVRITMCPPLQDV